MSSLKKEKEKDLSVCLMVPDFPDGRMLKKHHRKRAEMFGKHLADQYVAESWALGASVVGQKPFQLEYCYTSIS